MPTLIAVVENRRPLVRTPQLSRRVPHLFRSTLCASHIDHRALLNISVRQVLHSGPLLAESGGKGGGLGLRRGHRGSGVLVVRTAHVADEDGSLVANGAVK